jgi:phenylacetate-CoA ligase
MSLCFDELRALQLRRLQDALRRAYDRVPHYRSSFDAAGVHPRDLRDLEDIRHFPFTTVCSLSVREPRLL